MNKSYSYVNNKAVINLYDGNTIETEYYDNIEEMLSRENLIEHLNNEIINSKEEINELTKNENYPPKEVPILIGLSTVIPFVIYYYAVKHSYCLDKNALIELISKIYKNIELRIIIPAGISISAINYLNYIDKIKEKNGLYKRIEIIKEILKKQKEEFIKIKEEKKKYQETAYFKDRKVNSWSLDKEEKLKMNTYYDIGYNEQKYQNYYINNKLDTKLKKDHSKEEIDIIKEYYTRKLTIKK